jgi:hypothetical protein
VAQSDDKRPAYRPARRRRKAASASQRRSGGAGRNGGPRRALRQTAPTPARNQMPDPLMALDFWSIGNARTRPRWNLHRRARRRRLHPHGPLLRGREPTPSCHPDARHQEAHTLERLEMLGVRRTGAALQARGHPVLLEAVPLGCGAGASAELASARIRGLRDRPHKRRDGACLRPSLKKW